MANLNIYAQDKRGNRGPLITTAKYPTREQAEIAKRAIIWLCINQYKFPHEWKLKKCIPVVS